MPRKLILFIAMSLDGYIAREDGNIDFLSSVQTPGEDYGYKAFIDTIDTVIMGRKTYDKVLGFGIEFPHQDKRCIVLSRTRLGRDRHVEFYNGDVETLSRQLQESAGLDIFIDGGAEVVHQFAAMHLIDRYIISLLPLLLGRGIPLFKSDREPERLKLIENTAYPSGLVQLTYDRQ